ncbi:MAG TPA: OmpA family protein [Thermoanaerobaculia bacterium]|nr:OmpA family protein [Thermoanaerobaculia bacterium]
MRRLLVALLALAGAACSSEPRGGEAPAAGAGPAAAPSRAAGGGGGVGAAGTVPGGGGPAGVAGAAATVVDVVWEDPEPPKAQALAEQVVNAEWNRKRKVAWAPRKQLGLQMKILPLVNRTTGLAGFTSGLAGKTRSLDDRLAGLDAKVTDTEVTIRLPGSILFDFDSAAVRADAEPTLAEVAEVLKAYGERPARIEGHTDSIATDSYNLDLSKRRAESVRKWLGSHGVKAARLTAVGQGEAKPVADNSTAAGRQSNRRVEIVIAKK